MPSHLKMAMYMDCPSTLLRRTNMAINKTDIIKFWVNAEYRAPHKPSNSSCVK